MFGPLPEQYGSKPRPIKVSTKIGTRRVAQNAPQYPLGHFWIWILLFEASISLQRRTIIVTRRDAEAKCILRYDVITYSHDYRPIIARGCEQQ